MPRYEKAGHESSPSRFYPFTPAVASPSVINGDCTGLSSPYYDSRLRRAAARQILSNKKVGSRRRCDIGMYLRYTPMTVKCENIESSYTSVPRSLLRNDAFGGTIMPDGRRPCSGNRRGESRTGTRYRVTSSLGWK